VQHCGCSRAGELCSPRQVANHHRPCRFPASHHRLPSTLLCLRIDDRVRRCPEPPGGFRPNSPPTDQLSLHQVASPQVLDHNAAIGCRLPTRCWPWSCFNIPVLVPLVLCVPANEDRTPRSLNRRAIYALRPKLLCLRVSRPYAFWVASVSSESVVIRGRAVVMLNAVSTN